MKLLGRALVLALLTVLVSCDSQQKQQQQQITDNASSAASSDGSGKAAAAGSSAVNDRAQYNKRGAPEIQTIVGTPQHAYLNQPVVAGGAGSGLGAGTSSIAAVAPASAVAYATYAHPQQHQQQHQQLVQASSISSPQTIYHKINYVAPGSTLKVATYAAAAPAHYEYASAVPGLTKYQYAAAAAYPQYQYAAYPQQHQIQQQQQQPQYQVYQHHQTVQLPAASAIISAAPHPHQTVATLPGHHQLQPGTTIYAAHQPAATFHYTLTQPTQQQQQHNYQQQQSAGHPGTFTYHQAVPMVHQAPIAAIGQVHHHQQQQQVAANQYSVVPTAAAPLYATASTSPNQFYHQATNYAAYPVPLAAKQIVSTVAAPTIATPSHHQHHLKQLIPVTTATTTHHHGKGISYASFTQQANPASLVHLQQHYLQQQQQQHHQQQQQQQQQQPQQQLHQPRYQVYSTVATPLPQKPTLVYGPAGQPSIPAAIYATAPTHLQLAAFHQHQQNQQQQHQQQYQQQSAAVHYGTHLFQQQQPAYVAPVAKFNYGQVQAAAALQKGGYYHQVQ